MSKKILEIKEYIPGILRIRLEATKRKTLWVKVDRKVISNITACDERICSFYPNGLFMPSPLKKYPRFCEFCNHLFSEYPGLALRLATEFNVRNINQVVPIKKPKRI